MRPRVLIHRYLLRRVSSELPDDRCRGGRGRTNTNLSPYILVAGLLHGGFVGMSDVEAQVRQPGSTTVDVVLFGAPDSAVPEKHSQPVSPPRPAAPPQEPEQPKRSTTDTLPPADAPQDATSEVSEADAASQAKSQAETGALADTQGEAIGEAIADAMGRLDSRGGPDGSTAARADAARSGLESSGGEGSVQPKDGSSSGRAVRPSLRAVGRQASNRGGCGRRDCSDGLGGHGEQRGGIPVIAGAGFFGGKNKGALTGRLCFVPTGLKRLSQLKRCVPQGVLYTNRLNVPPRRFTTGFPGISGRSEWFAIDFNGAFYTSKAGEYKFRLHSDDGSLLWIKGEKLIDNDGTHGARSRVGRVMLREGRHTMRVLYFQGPRTMVALQLFVEPPGEPERLWEPRL